MEDAKLKKQIGINISTFRKRMGLTQAALADRLNYSDKQCPSGNAESLHRMC